MDGTPIEVVDYDSAWPDRFVAERERVRRDPGEGEAVTRPSRDEGASGEN